LDEEGSKNMTIARSTVGIALCSAIVILSASRLAHAQEDAALPAEVAEDLEAMPAEAIPGDEVGEFAGDEILPGDEILDDGEADGDEAGGALDYTLVELVAFGGVVGYLIIALSFVAVALVVDDALLLRRKVLMPPDEVDELREMIDAGRYQEVTETTRASFVGAMASAGVTERSRGYEAMVKAMEDCADGLTGRLLRRIEYLNIIANVTPMLGLLGTVIGMVKCFNQISIAVGGVDPRLLAAGIFQALMTTVMGLIVAIPSLFAFSLFRNRVDSLAAEATQRAEEIVAPLRPHDEEPVAVARLSSASS
jgi:biopolymer transport protein ExbB